MAGAVDITHGRECEVLADVEVLLAKQQEPFADQVALHDDQGVLLCHLQGERARVRPRAKEACPSPFGGQEGSGRSPTRPLEVTVAPCK